jgi:hypothetical protein
MGGSNTPPRRPDILPNIPGNPGTPSPTLGPVRPPVDPSDLTPVKDIIRKPHPGRDVCSADYARLLATSDQAVALVQNRYGQFAAGTLGRTVGQWRDWARKKLQVWHQHEYPIVVWDDATPIKAYTLAADALNKLDEGARALLPEVQKIKDEILGSPAFGNQSAKPGLLEIATTYPARYDTYLDETATMAAQIEVLEDILKQNKLPRSHNIDLDLPVANVKPDGSIAISTRIESFASKEQLEIQLLKMKDELKIRTGKKYFGANAMSNISVEQAVAIKKLETYMQELTRQFNKNADAKIPPDIKQIYEGILKLYKEDGVTLRDEYRLPYWAWDRLRWQQLRGELKSVAQKDLPKLKDQAQNDKILQFLKGLSPEEARALGVGKLAETSTLWGRTKFGGLGAYILGGGATFGTTTYGLSYPLQGVYQFVMGDRIAKQRCASLEDDYQFASCAQEYATLKFPGKATLQLFQSGKAFLDPEGNIQDEKVRREIKDLMARRQKFIQDLRYQQNSREATEEAIRRMMAEKDPGSDAYRQRVIETKDTNIFTFDLMGNGNPQVNSMLEYRFPVHFKAYRQELKAILDSQLDSELQIDQLTKLERKAPAMANGLRDILRDRARYLRDAEEAERLRNPPAPAAEEPPTQPETQPETPAEAAPIQSPPPSQPANRPRPGSFPDTIPGGGIMNGN